MAKNAVGAGHPVGPAIANNRPVPSGHKVSGNKAVSKPGQATPAEIWNPGVENPTPQPFLTQQDVEEYSEAREQYESGLHELDQNFEQTKHGNEYETAEIEKGRVSEVDHENWDAAGRGLFKSSIRDGDLADIDATAEIKKKFLSDSLATLKIYNDGQKAAQEAKWHQYERALNRKEVENAEGVSANMPKWAVEPHSEKPAAVPKVPAAAKPKPGFKINEPIGFKPGNQTSKNGGITAPAPNQSVSNRMPAKAASSVASGHIAGALYGKK